jgi:ketosteroid isomerase-like protein
MVLAPAWGHVQVTESNAAAEDLAQIRSVIDTWGEAYGGKRVDELMALFSEDFVSSVLDGKRELREYYRYAVEGGMMDGFVGIQYNPAAIRIRDDRARTGQVQVVTRTSAYPLVFLLAREDEGWKIVELADW